MWIGLIILSVSFLFFIADILKNSKGGQEYFSGENAKATQETRYASRNFLLTKCEVNFYKVLKLAAGDEMVICPMVRLGDLIKCTDRKLSSLNRINQKHIDFVLCERNSMKIACAIELNDRSHLENHRKIRDDFVRRALQEANIKLLMIPAATEYSVENLRRLIFSEIQELPMVAKRSSRTAQQQIFRNADWP